MAMQEDTPVKIEQNLTQHQDAASSGGWAARIKHALAALTRSSASEYADDAGMPAALLPGTPLREACLTLRTNLAAACGSTDLPPLLAIGTQPGRGCALAAAGLAAVLAQEGRATLLVDADIRHPQLHTLFGVTQEPGLAEVLDEAAAVASDEAYTQEGGLFINQIKTDRSAIATNVAEQLYVLSAGTTTRPVVELLQPAALRRVTRAFAERFDAVIYSVADQPSHPDALLLAVQIGTATLTVQSGSASADYLRRIRGRLDQNNVTLLGFTFVD